ncbi:DUF87 domain-containing protein [Aquifex pyrophilus]
MTIKVIKKEELYGTLREVLGKAEKSLKVASAWIRGEAFKELLTSLKEGVEIEVIVRAGELSDLEITDVSFFIAVKERGGKIYLNRKLHSKFLVVDEKIGVVGSSNITLRGIHRDGNEETNVLIEDESVKELLEEFERIKESSLDITGIKGFTLSVKNSKEGTAIFFEEVSEQSYFTTEKNDKVYLLRLVSLQESRELNNEVINRIMRSENEDWKRASLYAYMGEKPPLKVGNLEFICEYDKKEKVYRTEGFSLESGMPLLPATEKEYINEVFKRNHAGYKMSIPVYIGKLYGSDINTYLDAQKVITQHMVLLGTTGSGKTTFVRNFLGNLSEEVEVVVLDLHGEYGEPLKEKREVEEAEVDNVLFPVDVDDFKEILKVSGIVLEEKSAQEKNFFAFFRKSLIPDIKLIAYRDKSLRELIETAYQFLPVNMKDELRNMLEYLINQYGGNSVNAQPQVIKEIEELLNSENKLKIINLKNLDILQSRLNLVGLILKELFRRAREDRRKRLIVVEEAHNFAPEKGVGIAPYGKENIAQIVLHEIAMEGRKYNLGLIVVSQRPSNISKFVLSQMNTQVIFKLITKNDLEAVSQFFEHSKEDIYRRLPFLKVGTAYVSGLGVPFSFLVEIEGIIPQNP